MDDSVLDELDLDVSETDNKTDKHSTPFTIINTNARSLCPKIVSLIDCLEEMTATVGVVTETWLADGESLHADLDDLMNGAGALASSVGTVLPMLMGWRTGALPWPIGPASVQ